MLFGVRMKEERMKRNMTQKEFGDMLGVSATMIMYYEHGIKKPTVDQLLFIAETLQTSPNYLLGLEYEARERGEAYTFRISKQEIKIIKELRSRKQVYSMLIEDPRRTVELIKRKLS